MHRTYVALLGVALLLIAESSAFTAFENWLMEPFETKIRKFLDAHPSECSHDLKRLLTDLKKQKFWAMKMLDATPSFVPGMLEGNLRQFGHYDECLDVDSGDGIRGKYCLTQVDPYKSLSAMLHYNVRVYLQQMNLSTTVGWDRYMWSWGSCIPDVCNASELNYFSKQLEKELELKVHVIFDDEYCTTIDSNQLTLKTTLGILFFGIVILVALIHTTYDFSMMEANSERTWLTFLSLYSNTKRLFEYRQPAGSLTSIYGLKTLAICWMILGDTYLFNVLFPTTNTIELLKWVSEYKNLIVTASPLCVETFLVLSGFLVVYVNVQRPPQLHIFYIHRITRLFPALLATVIAHYAILVAFDNGPFWFVLNDFNSHSCTDNWWRTLTFSQNYLNLTDICVPSTWYLAVDTQLYLFAPILIYALIKQPPIGLLLLVIGFAGSTSSAIVSTRDYDLGATLISYSDAYLRHFYLPTWTRMSSWLIGAAAGYYFTTEHYNAKLGRGSALFGWLMFGLAMLFALYVHVYLIRNAYNRITAQLFNVLVRPMWSMGIVWIIFACEKGYGGAVNIFLSLRPFYVLAKLGYSMFLTHLMVIMFFMGYRRMPDYFSNTNSVYNFFSFYMYTFVIAVLWTLLFEMPLINAEKLIFKPRIKNVVGTAKRQNI